MSWLQDFSVLLKNYKCKNSKEADILQSLHLPPVDMVNKECMVVQWCKPPPGFFKLNVDRAARGNPGLAAGGGIIRNSNGDLIAAFSNFYGHTSNIVSEFFAIWDGLDLCFNMNLDLEKVVIESNSKVLVEMLMHGVCNLWQIKSH